MEELLTKNQAEWMKTDSTVEVLRFFCNRSAFMARRER
jgi:hypothetical protein